MHIWVYFSLELIVAEKSKKKKNKKEKSRLSQCQKLWKHLCEVSRNHGTFKHNQRPVTFERHESGFKASFCVCSIREFFQIFGQSLSWTTSMVNLLICITKWISQYKAKLVYMSILNCFYIIILLAIQGKFISYYIEP